LGGHTERDRDADGHERVRWIPDRVIKGTPYDTPISGYRVNTCNTLRLWKAEAAESFDFQAFNVGDYYGAVDEKVASENLTKVLYPNDEPIAGKRLRLEQQYFFVSCSLQNIIDIHQQADGRLEDLHKLWAVQLNDTHPAVAVTELMRLLVDEHLMEWDLAWHITVEQVKEQKARGYNPKEYYDSDEQLRQAIDQIRTGVFSRGDTSLFEPLVDALLQRDDYLVLADYRSYLECQDNAGQLYRDQNQWTRLAILNVARMGKFSSDRSIREYCEDIWRAKPEPIELAPLEF
jgi:glucan phosphorylase